MGEQPKKKIGVWSLFILPAIVVLLGIACIGYSSEIVARQAEWDKEKTIITGLVEATGENVLLDYNYDVDTNDYKVTDKTMQIKYTTERGSAVRSLYEKELWVEPNKQGTITFYVLDTGLSGKIESKITTIITIIGGFLILLGFLLATTGLKKVAAEITDDNDVALTK